MFVAFRSINTHMARRGNLIDTQQHVGRLDVCRRWFPETQRFAAAAALALTLGSAGVLAQNPGRNVNIVSGVTLPDGDPYLQRQNEPSVAASTRNPLHLLAGANDYRTVDIPGLPNGEETGDAWLGVFKSPDGGQRWKSTLIPGYPQDQSPSGLASPLKGYQAGADPVVRAGTNGLFYYAGLVFDRGTTGRSAIFVARFIDNNNRENGDPVAYLGTRIVAANPGTRFLDKPWLAVDIPRSGTTCTIPAPGNHTQEIPAGAAYVSWTAITGTGANLRSQILLSRSLDCGVTWSAPITLSRSQDPINQGTTIAIDPRTGAVIVAWRTFASPGGSDTDSIVAARSNDFGRKFDQPSEAHKFPKHSKAAKLPPWVFEHRGKDKDRGDEDDDDLPPGQAKLKFNPAKTVDTLATFDQSTGGDRFRTNGYPTMTIDGSGRVYVAWAERGFSTVPGRTSAVDGDAKIVMSTSSTGVGWTAARAVAEAAQPGHQFMPSLTFAGGKLMLVYYDLRDDISQSFAKFADDTSARPSNHRRTMDIRASLGTPGSVPAFAASVRVSDYAMGTPLGESVIRQLQFNPPNLPMFKNGTVPFVGDYIDLAPAPAFVPDLRGGWTYNTQARSTLPAFQAVWTDNRDVRPPTYHKPDGSLDWTHYTPPHSAFNPGAVCDPNSVGSRNQNIYTSRIAGGLVVGSPGNNKPLSATLQRGFVVFAQNTTAQIRTFRMTIPSQPAGGRASFSQFPAPPYSSTSAPPLASIDVTTAPLSLAARTVYVTSLDPRAQVRVDVKEISAVGGAPLPAGLQGTTFLNPDITNPDITNPDITNTNPSNPDITNSEVHNPDITNPDITNPVITNPDITNPDITNTSVMNPDITNPDITNPDITNPDITNPDITNPDITNPDITNAALTDVTWSMQNTGNTTTAYNVNLFLANQQLPGGIKYQLVLHKVYSNPVAINCDLAQQEKMVLVANIPHPDFVTPTSGAFVDQNDSRLTNPTLWLAPGEVGRITLRLLDYNPVGYVTLPSGATAPAALVPALQTITPVVIAQPVGSPEVLLGQTKPPAVTPNGSTILFLQQPTTVNIGQTIPAVAVQVRDSSGAVIAGTAVTLSLGANPGGALLTGGGPVVTDANGIATFAGLSLNAVGTGYTLVATVGASGLTPATSAPFDVKMPPPPPPTFVRQPTSANVGQAIPAVTVRALDGLGAALSGVTVTLSLGANPGDAVLAGGTVAVTGEGGLATFTGLSLNAAGTGYRLVATLGVAPFPTATSAPFNVTVPPPPAFVQQPTSVKVGQTISPAVTVRILDGNGAVLPGVPVTLSLGANPGGAVLTGGGPVVTDASGIATFAGLSLNAVGTGYTLVATVGAAGYVTTTSSSFDVTTPPPPPPPAAAITSATPSPVAAGFGQMILIRGTNLPGTTAANVVFSQGTFEGPAQFVWLATSSEVIARLPVEGLAPGPATVRIADLAAEITTAPYPITISLKPGAPQLLKAMAYNCSNGGASQAAVAGVTSGQNIGVAAEGIDTAGVEFLFSHTSNGVNFDQVVGPLPAPCTLADGQGNIVASVTVPALNPGWVTIQIRVTVNTVASDWSNPTVQPVLVPAGPVTVVGPVGGTGGSPFGPFDCAAGSMITSLRGRAGADIDRTEVWCSPVSGITVLTPETLAGAVGGFGGIDYGSKLSCPAGSVVTGLQGQAGFVVWGGNVVDTLGVICTDLAIGGVYTSPTVGNATPTPGYSISCPVGQHGIGIEGGQGALLDRIALRCQ